MEYISSDTNVWLDFVTINRLELPFKLPYIYLMNDEAVDDELLNPPSLGEDLIDRGLRKTRTAYEQVHQTLVIRLCRVGHSEGKKDYIVNRGRGT